MKATTDWREILPADVVNAIDDYHRFAKATPGSFGGARSLALLNIVAFIGERVAGLVLKSDEQITAGKK